MRLLLGTRAVRGCSMENGERRTEYEERRTTGSKTKIPRWTSAKPNYIFVELAANAESSSASGCPLFLSSDDLIG